MHPVLLAIGPITLFSFGFMLAVAVVVCSFLFGRDVQKIGLPKETAYDFIFWMALSGILGSRLFYIALNWDFFMQDPSEIYKLQNGGLAWQGGLLAVIAAGAFYLRKHRLPVLKFMDLASPYGALGQAIGRIGCFLNGCCYGKPVWWGVYFPLQDAHLHPTQIYESVGLLAIFFVLKVFNRRNTVEGRTFVLYLMLAAALRFVVQFFRDDHDPVWYGLSVFQWVAIGVMMFAVIFFCIVKKKTGEVR